MGRCSPAICPLRAAGGLLGGLLLAAAAPAEPDLLQPGAQDAGCPRDCRGTCFAGHCLFGGDALDARGERPRAVQPHGAAPAADGPRRAAGGLVGPGPPAAGGAQAAPPAGAAAGRGAGGGAAGAALLRAESAEAVVGRLARENALLRQQLDGWHDLGTKIADREARLAGFLARRSRPREGAPQAAEVAAAPHGSLLQDRAEQALESDVSRVPRYALAAFELVVAAVAAFLAYEFRGRLCCSTASASKRLLCGRLGVAARAVDVSELRLGNVRGIPKHTCVCVSVQLGVGQVVKTRATVLPENDAGNGCFLSFEESFRLEMPRGGGKCVISMLDQDAMDDDVIAWAEIPTRDLAGMARQDQEYFRVDLHVHSRWWDGPRGRMAGSRPYVAMRLNEG